MGLEAGVRLGLDAHSNAFGHVLLIRLFDAEDSCIEGLLDVHEAGALQCALQEWLEECGRGAST